MSVFVTVEPSHCLQDDPFMVKLQRDWLVPIGERESDEMPSSSCLARLAGVVTTAGILMSGLGTMTTVTPLRRCYFSFLTAATGQGNSARSQTLMRARVGAQVGPAPPPCPVPVDAALPPSPWAPLAPGRGAVVHGGSGGWGVSR